MRLSWMGSRECNADMKVAFLAEFRNSATDRVLRFVARQFQSTYGWETAVYNRGDLDLDPTKYDLLHFGWMGVTIPGYDVDMPTTANVWSVPIDKPDFIARRLIERSFDRLIVDDVGTLQQLGQLSLFRAAHRHGLIDDPIEETVHLRGTRGREAGDDLRRVLEAPRRVAGIDAFGGVTHMEVDARLET